MYRDDAEATRARITSLEAEIRATQRWIAARETGCKARAHLAAMKRVEALELQLAKAPAPPSVVHVPPEQAALERQVQQLRDELADLDMLGRGNAAMRAEIAASRAQIEGAETELAELRARRALKTTYSIEGEGRVAGPWRSVLGTLGLAATTVGLLVPSALVLGVPGVALMTSTGLFRWSRHRVELDRDGLRWTRLGLTGPNIARRAGSAGWDELHGIEFLPDGTLRMRYKKMWFRFSPERQEFSSIARTVLAAAARRGLPVGGEPPRLIEAARVHSQGDP